MVKVKTRLVFLSVVVLLSSVIGGAQASLLNSTEFSAHVTANCNVIELRMFNQTDRPFLVTGEIWAQQTEDALPFLLSTVPPQYQEIEPETWGGPQERIDNQFPAGFIGQVWGWAEITNLDDEPVSRTELARTSLDCGIPTTTRHSTFLPTTLSK